MENISDNIDAYIEYLTSLGKSKHTTVNYKIDLSHFKGYLSNQGITDVREIDTRAIRIFLSIWRTMISKCLSLIFTPCKRYTS